jgi:hypothetical protein
MSAILLAALLATLARAILLLLLAGILLATLLLLARLLARILILVGILVLAHEASFQRWCRRGFFEHSRPDVITATHDNSFRARRPIAAAEPRRDERVSFVPKQGLRRRIMGRYLLLWLLGIPLPILALIWIFGGLH